jgi:uncharacterized protein (TIGR00661 family)
MKFLFIIQGEGRGHLTQALALEEILKHNGHEVIGVMVGKSSSRSLPSFFTEKIGTPIELFTSPNFKSAGTCKRSPLLWSILFNLIRVPFYLKSMFAIRRRINNTKPDMVINFYELLTGLTYFTLFPSRPYISIGHQYMFLHPDFRFPLQKSKFQLAALRWFTILTSLRARCKLALSFYPMSEVQSRKLVIVPPLLRKEISTIKPQNEEYINGYLLNNGFASEVEQYHREHPKQPLRFFWDKRGAEKETRIDDTLTFYQIDDSLFLKCLGNCKAYATTAGFESICEALYLGKPVMMVPAHIEQDCNAFDAVRAGAGIICNNFDIDRLLRFTKSYSPHDDFIRWASSAELHFIREIEKIASSINHNKMTISKAVSSELT